MLGIPFLIGVILTWFGARYSFHHLKNLDSIKWIMGMPLLFAGILLIFLDVFVFRIIM